MPFSDGKKPAKWREFFFCEHLMDYPVRIPKWEGVRTRQYKYARYIEQDPPYEFLHDLKSDPSELRNLAGSAEHARELAMARKLCDRERDRLGGPYLKDPPPRTNRATQPATKKQGGKKQDQQATKKAATPNVLLIISDDQTWTDYGFMGHPVIQTPRLDQLARESVTFTRGYVPTALCRPSLMTMITGLYPSQHGVTGNDPAIPVNLKAGTARRDAAYLAECERLRSRVKTMPTIPRLLAQRGYLSFQTGKWWEGPHSYGGFTHGMTHGDFTRGGRHGDAGLAIGRTGLQPVYDFIDLATTQQKPFFIWYAPFLPHTPHNPPPRILKKYEQVGRSPALAKYYAMCEWFDETCGSLLDHLDDRKLSKNTLVIYVTDNGWIQRTSTTKVPDGWRPRFAPKSKQSPYDGGVRTPIMVR